MSEQHSTGQPELGKPGLTLNDDHGAAAPGDVPLSDRPGTAGVLREVTAEELKQEEDDLEVESQLITLTTTHAPMMQFFSFAHLKPHLRDVSRHFANLAIIILTLPGNAERTVALRKLLEAKDAAVRARLMR